MTASRRCYSVTSAAARSKNHGDIAGCEHGEDDRTGVPGEESDIQDEPLLEAHRITVQYTHVQVAERGLDPETVADTFALDVADVYRVLTYYYDHPEEMCEVEWKREHAIEDHEHLTTDPDAVRE